ncbi:MAG: GNAT family N-acetyltransferase [Roseibium sp.]|uniref:GNAT family N-acetyltransferase n=1 Tax=Roseibium sp. TaxID=1936156 RepID=UPI0026153E44|nr:GNAT family N-acetyltransferase [Roseibium sp.]MCV0426264.1 GNAT family N-acetyltransferase [Roseibium sp.]
MSDDFTIRKAKLTDKDSLTDLSMRSKQSNGYDDAFMAQCVEELRVRASWIEDHDFWVAEAQDGKLVGCIRLSMEPAMRSGELETCFVDPDWKGKGVGRQLFDRLFARAVSGGLSRVGVDSDPEAEPFYARMGFRTIGRSPSGSIPGRTLPRMELILARDIEEKPNGAGD